VISPATILTLLVIQTASSKIKQAKVLLITVIQKNTPVTRQAIKLKQLVMTVAKQFATRVKAIETKREKPRTIKTKPR
jgi:hypothetical protein